MVLYFLEVTQLQKKVSMENYNFKAISVENLNDLTVETVLEKVKSKLN